jgi:uncharacterized membrane protein
MGQLGGTGPRAMTDHPSSAVHPDHTFTALGHRLSRIPPWVWLGTAVVTYFAVSFALSWLRSFDLTTSTWDMGIYQQALWSTAHGRPFYESADFETGGYRSLLQVHTVFLFFLLAPIYAALPYQATLFFVQSLVVAAAAVPLYLLGRDLTHSSRWGLVTAVVYLVWLPTLSSNLYDFHPEAFLPVELFTVVLLWERERYAAGAVAVALAFGTMELAPVLLLFVGVFFLLPSSATWARWLERAEGSVHWSTWTRDFRSALASRRVLASLGLVAASLAVYFLLVYYRVDVLSGSLGVMPRPYPVTGYVIGYTPSSLGLSLQNLSFGFGVKVAYWAFLVALLGLVPLLAPRALVVSLPWFAFTMLSGTTSFVEVGFQYGFIAGATIMVAFAYGLPRALTLFQSWMTPVSPSVAPHVPVAVRSRSWHRRKGAALLAIGVVFVGVNLMLSPANPLLQGQPTFGTAYQITYTPLPGYENVQKVAALIPPGATVIASDLLFPLVANDENAYSLLWVQDNFLTLPFNTTHLPQFVFLSGLRTGAVPAWLGSELYNRTSFGARGVAWTSNAGPVLLFQAGYNGPDAVYGSVPTVPLLETGSALVYPAAGFVPAASAGLPSGVVESVPGVVGTFFYGPWANLSAGNYSVTLTVRAAAIPGAPPVSSSESPLWIGASAFAQPPYFGWALAFNNLKPQGWTNITFNVSLPGPTIQFEVQGVALATNAQAFLESVAIVPVRPQAAGS